MINPEVINFAPPRNVVQSCLVKNTHVSSRISTEELGNHFHGVTAVLPFEDASEIRGYFQDTYYYRVSAFPAYQLLEPEFLSAFIRKGIYSAKTLNTWNEVDESVTVEHGKLCLSVGKDTYQELGIEGQPEIACSKNVLKYRITLNLLDEKLSNGSKYYKRIVWCLKKHESLQFNWIMLWEPHDDSICPSSLAAYLDLNGFKVVQCQPSLEEMHLPQLTVPLLAPQTRIMDVMEWIGTAVLNIENLKQIDYVSSLTCPEPNYLSNEVKILKWTGFFTLKNAKKLLNAMLDMNLEVEHHSPLQHSWLNLTLHGFDDIHTANNISSLFVTTSGICHIVTSKSSRIQIK